MPSKTFSFTEVNNFFMDHYKFNLKELLKDISDNEEKQQTMDDITGFWNIFYNTYSEVFNFETLPLRIFVAEYKEYAINSQGNSKKYDPNKFNILYKWAQTAITNSQLLSQNSEIYLYFSPFWNFKSNATEELQFEKDFLAFLKSKAPQKDDFGLYSYEENFEIWEKNVKYLSEYLIAKELREKTAKINARPDSPYHPALRDPIRYVWEGGIGSTLIHEFGHVLDYFYLDKTKNAINNVFNSSYLSQLFIKYINQHATELGEDAFPNRSQNPIIFANKVVGSTYAADSIGELFAEAFAKWIYIKLKQKENHNPSPSDVLITTFFEKTLVSLLKTMPNLVGEKPPVAKTNKKNVL